MVSMTAAGRVTVAGADIHTAHHIGGEWVGSTTTFPTHSPSTGEHLADISRGGRVEVDAAVAAATEAFPAWAALGPEGRRPLLTRFAELIVANGERLVAVEAADSGGRVATIRGFVPRWGWNITYFADRALTMNDRVMDGPGVVNNIRYDPAGPCALITPWNGPASMSTWKLGPCLAAGNTAVLKPPEWAPLTCAMLAELAQEAGIPPGVLNVVQGMGEEAGAALVAHPGIRRISFTGSPETARSIAAAAAQNLVPLSFELGGKSPAIVFDDADLDLALQLALVPFSSGGQGCVFGTRLLVQDTIADEFYRRFIEMAQNLEPGEPDGPDTDLSPLIHPDHLRRVQGFVDRAQRDGATLVFGGKVDDYGPLFYEPTLFTDVPAGSEIEQSEVFGPVITWQTFSDEAEAVEIANRTQYGLSAEVFTRSSARAMRVAEQIRAGSVWVNCFMVRDVAAPFGGIGLSGVGREGGEWSFDFYCDVKNIGVAPGSLS